MQPICVLVTGTKYDKKSWTKMSYLRAALKTCASIASFPMIVQSNGMANANSTAPKPAPT